VDAATGREERRSVRLRLDVGAGHGREVDAVEADVDRVDARRVVETDLEARGRRRRFVDERHAVEGRRLLNAGDFLRVFLVFLVEVTAVRVRQAAVGGLR